MECNAFHLGPFNHYTPIAFIIEGLYHPKSFDLIAEVSKFPVLKQMIITLKNHTLFLCIHFTVSYSIWTWLPSLIVITWRTLTGINMRRRLPNLVCGILTLNPVEGKMPWHEEIFSSIQISRGIVRWPISWRICINIRNEILSIDWKQATRSTLVGELAMVNYCLGLSTLYIFYLAIYCDVDKRRRSNVDNTINEEKNKAAVCV